MSGLGVLSPLPRLCQRARQGTSSARARCRSTRRSAAIDGSLSAFGNQARRYEGEGATTRASMTTGPDLTCVSSPRSASERVGPGPRRGEIGESAANREALLGISARTPRCPREEPDKRGESRRAYSCKSKRRMSSAEWQLDSQRRRRRKHLEPEPRKSSVKGGPVSKGSSSRPSPPG